MTVKRKISKTNDNASINDIINRGGKTVQEIIEDDQIRFTLRIPKKLMDKIDARRELKIGSYSRNQWILDAIEKLLK